MMAWVLWHRYSDGSGAHIERVYLDGERAKEDHALLTEGDACKTSSREWFLAEVPITGRKR